MKKYNLHSAIFYTRNLTESVDFYVQLLEFEIEYIQQGRFASFILGECRLGIKQAKEEREIPGHQTVFVMTDDIVQLYEALKARRVTFSKHLVEEDWATNFALLDPDGNKMLFIAGK